MRSYKPTAHRHAAEIIQELSFGEKIQIHFSATSVDMIRGTMATSHVFLKEGLTEKDIWKIYRQAYGNEPFIRIIKEKEGNYRYPEPKLCIGTNYCDIGFERDPHSNRLVVISAIDNLMKGAAGQALQAFNIMYGFNETAGLEFPGLHPI
jgi:N-acetyl-gamma-glutamyl-phosphate/LysW-gamma-L-alpha-aminoadipyl-6-phosphate reductase